VRTGRTARCTAQDEEIVVRVKAKGWTMPPLAELEPASDAVVDGRSASPEMVAVRGLGIKFCRSRVMVSRVRDCGEVKMGRRCEGGHFL
jgi:hypothetical protein